MTAPKFPEDWPDTVWTSEEWHRAMLAHLDAWLNRPKETASASSLIKHMFMSFEEFVNWRETSIVPKNTRIYFTIFPEQLCI